MTPEQTKLVQSGFEQLAPIADVIAELFYARLFDLDPDLRRMFQADLRTQGMKLMRMLAAVVDGLDEPETLLPQVAQLGARHREYGVTERDYATAGSALLWTLEIGLAPAFTAEMREAWTASYALLSDVMQHPFRYVAAA